jgi:hypothetical protein
MISILSSSGRGMVPLVGRSDEKNIRQIKPYIEIMIEKIAVLFRIQNFKKRSRRVALVTGSNLIYFVKHYYGVRHFCAFQALNQLSGHCTYISTSMPLNFSFIAHATDRETIKLAAQSIGNRFTNGRFNLHPEGLPGSIDPDTTPRFAIC